VSRNIAGIVEGGKIKEFTPRAQKKKRNPRAQPGMAVPQEESKRTA
jgi:hypothetical protein